MKGWLKMKVLSECQQPEQGDHESPGSMWLMCQELERPASLSEYSRRLGSQVLKWPKFWLGARHTPQSKSWLLEGPAGPSQTLQRP